MKTFDVIIIGAGLGGLTAGAKLAKEGKKVCLIEQHTVPGGCATIFHRKDFIVEVGLHELDGLDKDDPKVKIFEDLEVFNHVNFIKIPEFYRFNHGKIDIVIPNNKQEAMNILIEKFPKEKQGIQKFFKKIFTIHNEVNKIPHKKWKLFMLFPIFPLLFPHLVFNSHKNLGDFLDEIIKDEELKLILQANLSYYHDDPYSMSLIYFAVAQASFFKGGGHFIKGGSQELSNHLAKIISNNGGEILFANKVEKILIKDKKAVGVEYKKTKSKDNTTYRLFAKTIIANTAIPNVVELVPPKYKKMLDKKLEKLKISSSILSVYIGFKKEIKDLGNRNYSTFIFDESLKNIKEVSSQNHSNNVKKRIFTFLDYSQIDSGLASRGKSLGVISMTDYISNWENLNKQEYKSKKEEIAKILINRLEQIIPNISNEIEYLEVATPKTIQRYTLNPQGTAYGYAQTPQQSGMYRLANKSPIKNLYFASAWVNPGGGFTGAILSGWYCANEIL